MTTKTKHMKKPKDLNNRFDKYIKQKEKLIYDILFSDETLFEIDLQIYCDINKRSDFREEIRIVIKKGNLSIIDDRIIHTDDKVIWKLEIKK